MTLRRVAAHSLTTELHTGSRLVSAILTNTEIAVFFTGSLGTGVGRERIL